MTKQKLMIGTGILAVLVLIGAAGFRAGSHLTEKRIMAEVGEILPEEGQEIEEEMEQEETEEQAETKKSQLKLEAFEEHLGELMGSKELENVKEAVVDYFTESSLHKDITSVTCLKYVTNEGMLVSFYMKLSDGILVAGYYHGDTKETVIKETAVTEKILEENEAAEKKKEEQLRLSELAFEQPEGGAPGQETETPTPSATPKATPSATPKVTTTPKITISPTTSGNNGFEQVGAENVYPYQFENFHIFNDYLSAEQIEEVKGWISGLLQESDYQEIEVVSAIQAEMTQGVLVVFATLDDTGTLEISYDLSAGQATISFDTVSIEELQS